MNVRIKFWLTMLILCWVSAVLAAEERQKIPLQTYGANTYYIDSQIQGAGQFTLLVDTGSGYSVINENTLALLMASGSAVYIKDLRGVLADGSTRIVPLYRVTAITLGESCVIQDIEAAVFPGDTRQILGISALQKISPFEISFDPPMLSLSRCSLSAAQIPSGVQKATRQEMSLPIATSGDQKIPESVEVSQMPVAPQS